MSSGVSNASAVTTSNTSSDLNAAAAYRKVLQHVISNICSEQGYSSSEHLALETLSEILQATLISLCQSTKSYAELAGRTGATGADVCLAIVDSGIKMEGMREMTRRPQRSIVQNPGSQTQTSAPRTLQAGERRELPPYIPDHLPPFPDSHAYVHTTTHRQPVTEYVAIREKLASQKRDIERALTRFVAKTSGTQTLFPENPQVYPLIACKVNTQPWISALLPKDQIFEDGEDEEKEETMLPEREGVLDNPYLQGVKMPRKRY